MRSKKTSSFLSGPVPELPPLLFFFFFFFLLRDEIINALFSAAKDTRAPSPSRSFLKCLFLPFPKDNLGYFLFQTLHKWNFSVLSPSFFLPHLLSVPSLSFSLSGSGDTRPARAEFGDHCVTRSSLALRLYVSSPFFFWGHKHQISLWARWTSLPPPPPSQRRTPFSSISPPPLPRWD